MKEEGALLLFANIDRDLRTLTMIGNVHDIQKDSEHLGDGVMNHKTTGTVIQVQWVSLNVIPLVQARFMILSGLFHNPGSQF